MPQLSFKWPVSPSYAPEDFILSPANEEAARFLDIWPRTDSQPIALLSGPEACGKTHLATRWRARVGAATIDPSVLGRTDSGALWQGTTHAVLEDVHAVTNETALFHLLRHAETQGLFLLLTSRQSPRQLSFILPDLRSRLLALPATAIHAPDEALLKGFLLKCFTDRQLTVGEEVIGYLARRTERSFAAARAVVEAVETQAFEEKREITVPFMRRFLG
jgi:chromosomal replication initiation ATPase DnaA